MLSPDRIIKPETLTANYLNQPHDDARGTFMASTKSVGVYCLGRKQLKQVHVVVENVSRVQGHL